MNQTDLTPVAVITMLASLIFSASVAAVVGPYVVIGIGAMGGAAVALMQAETRGRLGAFLFFFGYATLAVMLTVPVSMLVTAYFTSVQQHWLFTPLSFGLGFVADKWPAVLSAIGRKVGTFIDLLIQLRGPKP